jgi:hypothetical protein
MSSVLLNAVHSPITNGMIIKDDPNNPQCYTMVAYHHPDSPHTFFAATAGKTALENGEWVHKGLESAVKKRPIPTKPDSLVSIGRRPS